MTITKPNLYQTAYFAWQIIRSNIFYYTWCSLYRRHMSKKFMAISLNFKCCCKQSLSLDKIGLLRVASTLSTVGMSPLDHNFRSVNSVQQLWVGSMSSWELRKMSNLLLWWVGFHNWIFLYRIRIQRFNKTCSLIIT